MRVLHVVPSLGPLRGGPSFAVPVTAHGLTRCGVEVHVATTDDNGRERLHVPLDRPVVHDGVRTRYFPRQTRFYTFSWPLTRWLLQHAGDYDLLHIYALFSYATAPASWAAAQHGVPYIIEPVGTLNRWGMSQRRRRLKQLSFHVIERRILRGAAAIRYTTEQERIEAQGLGVQTPPAVIPLGIDLHAFERPTSPDRFLQRYPQLAGQTLILFLSRLDPKKGLHLLLPAFARLHRACPETVLVLAGDGEGAFVAGLRAAVHSLGLDNRVVFTGFLAGEEKLSALAAADAFVLPSYSENFGVAPVEAMAAGIPVVLSEHVGVSAEARQWEAGFVVPTEIEAIANSLERLVHDRELRCRLGENGRRLAQTRFTPEATARELLALYERVLERRTKHVA